MTEEGYFTQTILQELENGLVILNREGQIIEFNPAAQRITGYQREEVIGRFYREIWGVDPPPATQERETSIGSKKVSIKSKISPVINEAGELLGWVDIFQDLSPVQEKMALAEVGEAAAQVAHEIKNPLGGIKGFASLLKREAREESQERLITHIAEGIANIDKLVNDLLDFTRPQPQPKQLVDLNLIAQEALTLLAQEADLRKIAVESQMKGKGMKIEGHSLKLRQAILNLLLNAVQAMPQGGKVVIKTFRRGERASISISDTGCGIPPQFKDQIFKPFFSKREGGTGLGLALVRRIVSAHQGEISLRSKVGKGTTVSLYFPLPSSSEKSPTKIRDRSSNLRSRKNK